VANRYDGGISGARNTGIDCASGEVVVFLDDDAIAEPDWLAALLVPYARPDVLGVGGKILPLWRFGRPTWFPAEFNWVVGCSYAGLPAVQAKVRNPIGASLSVRRDVLASVDGFDHSMGHVAAEDHNIVTGTADETEMCIRASQRWPGHHWVYEPDARVHHVVPPGRLTWSYFVGRCRMEGTAKAVLVEMAGADQSLASERRYLRDVLPRAVVRESLTALRTRTAVPLTRAGAVLVGTVITALAYLQTLLQLRRATA
jgi:glycosyltransferase involved in cell wall biosynthesis